MLESFKGEHVTLRGDQVPKVAHAFKTSLAFDPVWHARSMYARVKLASGICVRVCGWVCGVFVSGILRSAFRGLDV